MARGESGRVVIEVDPALKQRLYIALAAEGSTLKNWFIENVEHFVEEHDQPSLSLNTRPPNVPPLSVD
jgi:hypothetical protein